MVISKITIFILNSNNHEKDRLLCESMSLCTMSVILQKLKSWHCNDGGGILIIFRSCSPSLFEEFCRKVTEEITSAPACLWTGEDNWKKKKAETVLRYVKAKAKDDSLWERWFILCISFIEVCADYSPSLKAKC